MMPLVCGGFIHYIVDLDRVNKYTFKDEDREWRVEEIKSVSEKQ
jgi:hypothetical protein